MAMFTNTRSTPSASGHIVEFKAGRSRLEAGSGGDSTKKVIAEAAKGLVYIKQSNDMLVHFCWKNRETGALVDDLIIFPDDAEFKAVTGCPDGKVFMLKFKSSGEMKLFWLQDSSVDAEGLVKKVNDALNKPATSRPSGASRSSNAERPSAGSSLASGQDFNAMGGLDQSQLMSLIQSLQGNESMSSLTSGGSTAATAGTVEEPSSEADCEPPTGEGSSSGRPLSLQDPAIRRAFLNIERKNERGVRKVFLQMSEILSNETVAEVARQHADELIPLLPPSENPQQELSDTVRTPQFRQAADALGTALQAAQLRPLLEQFGLHENVLKAADDGSILNFAKDLTRTGGGHHIEDSSPESGVTKTPPSERDVESVASEESGSEPREPEPKRNRPDDMDDMDVD